MFPDPKKLFLECLHNPEPLIDEAYCYDELIVSKGVRHNPTEIMKVQQVLKNECLLGIVFHTPQGFYIVKDRMNPLYVIQTSMSLKLCFSSSSYLLPLSICLLTISILLFSINPFFEL